MINSQNFKTLWWGILVIVIGYYLYGRYDSLIEGAPSYFDVVVFLVWTGVCLAPIFQEMNLFGVKLKQDIEDLRKDISHQFSIMKAEVKSSMEVSSANSNQIYFHSAEVPPNDSEIPSISEQIQKELGRLGISPSVDVTERFEVNPVHVEMFKVRLAFENLLRRYGESDDRIGRRYPIGKVLNELRNYDGISKQVLAGTSEIMAICNYAVHGEELSNAQVDFVRESAPGLLEALTAELQTGL